MHTSRALLAPLAVILGCTVAPIASAQDMYPGEDVTVNLSAVGGNGVLLYPGGKYGRIVRPLRQPGDTEAPIHLHMPVHRIARHETPKPETAVASLDHAAPAAPSAPAAPAPSAPAPQSDILPDTAANLAMPTDVVMSAKPAAPAAKPVATAKPAPLRPVQTPAPKAPPQLAQAPKAPPQPAQAPKAPAPEAHKPVPVEVAKAAPSPQMPKPAPAAYRPAPVPFSLSPEPGESATPQAQVASADPAPAAAAPGSARATSQAIAGLIKQSQILFATGVPDPAPDSIDAIKGLASPLNSALAAGATRVQVVAYGGSRGDKSSDARRLSLKRALIIRQLLIDGGVPSERIDVRAMGGTTDDEPTDRVDIFTKA